MKEKFIVVREYPKLNLVLLNVSNIVQIDTWTCEDCADCSFITLGVHISRKRNIPYGIIAVDSVKDIIKQLEEE